MTPPLNWRELALLMNQVRDDIEGKFIEKIQVPERKYFPAGYLKEEWALRLTGQKQEGTLIISLRPRHPYLLWSPGKGIPTAQKATHSPFDLFLSKHLKGGKLLKAQVLHQDRTVILWFTHPEDSALGLGLVLVMIPARPEALLVVGPIPSAQSAAPQEGWPILARSRTVSAVNKEKAAVFLPSNGSKAPQAPSVREELVSSASAYFKEITHQLQAEAFLLRTQIAEKALQQLLKHTRDRLKQSEAALRQGLQEPDWQNWADLLKASLGLDPERVVLDTTLAKTPHHWRVQDYYTGQFIDIPGDETLSLTDQVKKYYEKAKRKQRKIQESGLRSDDFRKTIERIEAHLLTRPIPVQWEHLEKFERAAGIAPLLSSSVPNTQFTKKLKTWTGKSFLSKDGLPIWVGRSKDENLELTFKFARGNDIWMHVRGRPGAHVVVPVPQGKSAPLETLLDAAQLTLHYSNGKDWGKTEVDYTHKKYVKRIKDSKEASYTHNKTLLVTPDPERIKKLLDQS